MRKNTVTKTDVLKQRTTAQRAPCPSTGVTGEQILQKRGVKAYFIRTLTEVDKSPEHTKVTCYRRNQLKSMFPTHGSCTLSHIHPRAWTTRHWRVPPLATPARAPAKIHRK
ncbi:hypothetical protein L484_000510 [Morus notabilis]|uniref:Uncharacterized protein n=1 Tax=Morus notabilis TaxID=981085 RepID=W9SNK2_9ROSA|nr:hypothetical protein L484_000510 [Morus notabilis]